MFEIIRAEQRGLAQFGWLTSRHTFSFGDYYNPAQMGFSALRVLNDDAVTAGAGFQRHSHRNMEIISYVQAGRMVHQDSTGQHTELPAGEFQLMSAGKGIAHSEFNGSQSEGLKFLQIWIQPNELNTEPSYQQQDFGQSPGLTMIVTPHGRDGTLQIKQDASLAQLIAAPEQHYSLPTMLNRAYYLHLIEGELSLSSPLFAEQQLRPGDGIKLWQIAELSAIAGSQKVQALWFDLPT